MTATYDGRLRSTPKGIEPCCATLHAWAVLGRVYRPAKGGLAIRVEDRKGAEMRYCPFCGARLEASE